jgi:5-(carboxyamino)imidazole ribonucleotide synthase
MAISALAADAQLAYRRRALDESGAGAGHRCALQQRATKLARTLAERLGYVGVFALELFVKDGELLGNEMAPRVHNSGHWTIEGAHTSQFENHVRAVLGLPLGDTGARFVGDVQLDRRSARSAPVLRAVDAHWHDYGKQARPGRKVGHATLCAPDACEAARVGDIAELGAKSRRTGTASSADAITVQAFGRR